MADRPIGGVVLRARVSHAGVKGERSLALAIVKVSRRRDIPDSFSNLSVDKYFRLSGYSEVRQDDRSSLKRVSGSKNGKALSRDKNNEELRFILWNSFVTN